MLFLFALQFKNENINPIFEEIKGLINTSRNRVYSAVNTEMLKLHLPTEEELIEAIEEEKMNLELNEIT